jgi:NhaA family Na+:H+ antiporter
VTLRSADDRRPLDPLRDFLHGESAGGVVLALAVVAALAWANGPLSGGYDDFWHREVTVGGGPFTITEDLRHWVNDGLMAVFFFVVGLEIKRELVTGELRDPRAAALPGIAAVGGVLLPAGIFLALTAGTPGEAGWGIPMAIDIAFAVGVLALLGDRIPAGAKLFLLAVAIVDDIIAIMVIAVAYTSTLSLAWLAVALGALALTVVLRRLGVAAIWPYVPVGVLAWVATLQSGVHATITGVALGLLTPARPVAGRPVLDRLEHRLHPISAFVVVPVFALANAGVVFGADVLREAATSTLPWAIGAGLVVGKSVGIAGATLLAIRLRLGALPEGVGLRQLWGVAALGGIGFTVSLFIADLAYTDTALAETAKIGIFAGSLFAGILGAALLLTTRRTGPRSTGRVEEVVRA